MEARDRLKAIAELKSSENAWHTDDAQLAVFVKKLIGFIDILPSHEEAAKSALKTDNINGIIENITTVQKLLVQIHADRMAEDCLKRIADLKIMDKIQLETYVENFFSSVLSLSIDIQMAIFTKKSEEKPAAASKNKKLSILAVDDSPFSLRTLKNCLEDTQYKLTCVSSGEDALRFLEKNTVDLIIMDIMMPEMDGYQTVQHIRKRLILSPVIFLTGNANKEHVLKAMEIGAADFIVKPINRILALEKINNCINR